MEYEIHRRSSNCCDVTRHYVTTSGMSSLDNDVTSYEASMYEEGKCTCTESRILLNDKSIPTSADRRYSKRRHRHIVRLVVSYRTWKYCFHIFIAWTLILAPLFDDVIRQTLPVYPSLSLGGVKAAQGCHPGSMGAGPRPRPWSNVQPFQKNEYVPKLSEQTIGASGPAEGPIYLDSKRYIKELIPNYNPDIIFLDEEQTNEDRMMTKRCKDRLNTLAILVANRWPDAKLRVTEGYEPPTSDNYINKERALHYEGRAVDITTKDQDLSKYPVLARLAVIARFDWVIYKTSYVHASVRSDSSEAAQNDGCFPGSSLVQIPGGTAIPMDHLKPGDKVFSVDPKGLIVQDKILGFMDIRRDIYSGKQASRGFVSIATETGHIVRLTQNHLIYTTKLSFGGNSTASNTVPSTSESTVIFAGNVKKGDHIFVNEPSNASVRPSKVINVDHVAMTSGAYAPLTRQGTILVEGTMTSCYAVIESHSIAHAVITPLRYYYMLWDWISYGTFSENLDPNNRNVSQDHDSSTEGVLPYAKFLYKIGFNLLPSSIFWGE